ncbi:MAG: hypothetical protein AB3N33_00180 [Puniceicoccaceae bacterium]
MGTRIPSGKRKHSRQPGWLISALPVASFGQFLRGTPVLST